MLEPDEFYNQPDKYGKLEKKKPKKACPPNRYLKRYKDK